MPLAFFYNQKQLDSSSKSSPSQITHLLENSLSKTLVSYYPYAGTVRDNSIIECDDAGIQFLTVRMEYPMSEVLNSLDSKIKDLVFPIGLPWSNYSFGPLGVAQLTFFNCGGIAISWGFCVYT